MGRERVDVAKTTTQTALERHIALATLPFVRVGELEEWFLTDLGHQSWFSNSTSASMGDVLGMSVRGWTDLHAVTQEVDLRQLGLALHHWLRDQPLDPSAANGKCLVGGDWVPQLLLDAAMQHVDETRPTTELKPFGEFLRELPTVPPINMRVVPKSGSGSEIGSAAGEAAEIPRRNDAFSRLLYERPAAGELKMPDWVWSLDHQFNGIESSALRVGWRSWNNQRSCDLMAVNADGVGASDYSESDVNMAPDNQIDSSSHPRGG